MSDEAYEEARKRLVDYFFDDKDVGEAISTMRGWGASFDARAPSFVERFLVAGFERRQMDWAAAARLFRAMPEVCSAASLVAGARLVLDNLEDHMCDLPKADAHLAAMLAGPVADGAVALPAVAGSEARGPRRRGGPAWPRASRCRSHVQILVAVADVAGPARAEAAFGRRRRPRRVHRRARPEGSVGRRGDGKRPQRHPADGRDGVHRRGARGARERRRVAEQVRATLERSVPVAVRRSEVRRGGGGAALRVAIPGDPAAADVASPIAALEPLAALLRSAVAGPSEDVGEDKEGGEDSERRNREARDARERAALFAAQRFADAAGHPKGLLTRVFRDLYNGDVLDEPAMQRWREDEGNRVGLEEVAGKAKAVFDVAEYLHELEAAGEEDAQEE